MRETDAIVIGTGVIGLAAACRLALDGTVVLQREKAIGTATSLRSAMHREFFDPTPETENRHHWSSHHCRTVTNRPSLRYHLGASRPTSPLSPQQHLHAGQY